MAIKNYLKDAKEITAPLNWKSAPDSPPTQLAYITQPEIDLLVKANLHGSMKGKPNKGPKGIISLDGLGAEDTAVGEEKISDKPFSSNIVTGYTGSGSQSGNQMGPGGPGGDTYNPDLSSQNQLAAIVANKQNLVNQAGVPKYLTNKFKNLFPGGNIPYNQMTEAQKSIANFYAGSTPNAYQQAINNFISSNPANMQVYKDSGLKGAGLNAFMTTAPEAIAEKSLFMQGLKSLAGVGENVFEQIGNAYKIGKEKAGDMMDAGADIFSSDPVNQQGSTFTAQSVPVASPLSGIPSILNTSTDTPLKTPPERIFVLPGGQIATLTTQVPYNPNLGYQTTGNYLTMNPELERLQMKTLPTGMAEGGLASLNNPDYSRLMGASNFGF